MVATGEVSTPRSLTDATVQQYREQGFVRIPSVLTEAEVAAFFAASEELLAKERPQVWGATEAETEVLYIEEAWLKSETLRRLALHPVITALAERLAGGALRLYSSDILTKQPHKALPTMVHDDEMGLPLANQSRTLTAWIALIDVPVERGCLIFVPGSHLRPDSERQVHMTQFTDYRAMADVWPQFPWAPRVTVPLRAGDVTFHHFRTVHMAGANDSDRPRMGHGVIYMDDHATYWPGVQDHHLGHLREGQELDGEKFPLIASR